SAGRPHLGDDRLVLAGGSLHGVPGIRLWRLGILVGLAGRGAESDRDQRHGQPGGVQQGDHVIPVVWCEDNQDRDNKPWSSAWAPPCVRNRLPRTASAVTTAAPM